jgi:hypothetical protein
MNATGYSASRPQFNLASALIILTAFAVGMGADFRWPGASFYCVAAVSVAFVGVLCGVATEFWIRRSSASRPKYIVLTHGAAQTILTLESRTEIMIGRHRGCDVVIPFDSVSSRHCRLYRHRNNWFVEDLKSTNGTYVDGQVIERSTKLKVGRTIAIAQHTVITVC